ncbi:MAG: molybdopterin-dependent oxidoreductase [Gammaproteobacteria bacterium]
MKHAVRTFCRICEPACGLVAEVEDGRVCAVGPDREHPVSRGFCCRKGIALLDLHRDPDRLDQPLARGPAGFAEVGWNAAAAEIGKRLRRILDRDGPEAVAGYAGNPLGFNALGTDAFMRFLRTLGSTRRFDASTQDCANKYAASAAVYGSTTVQPIPDLAHTRLLLVIGANPRVSHGSFIAAPGLHADLRAIAARGGRVVFVDPRRIEEPQRGLGETLLIRPDTDAWFLAALLHAIDRRGGLDEAVLAAHGRNVQGLRRFIAGYSPERVAPVTGIDAAAVEDLAGAWLEAGGATVYASTGLNMGSAGTLAYWLVQMLAFATGNLDRRGGNLKSEGFYPNSGAGTVDYADSRTRIEFGPGLAGVLPGSLLADYILDARQPVRALFVAAGNPLLSCAGEPRLARALAQLELLVCVDLYRNATGEHAHFLLPATDQLEREDLNLVGLGLQSPPWVQFTPAVAAPKGGRRNEWWIFARLAQAAGLPSPLDTPGFDPWGKLRHMFARGGLDFDALRADPRALLLPVPAPGRFFEDHVRHADRRVDCCPAAFGDAIDALEAEFRRRLATPAQMLLISGREPLMHNSWFENLAPMRARADRGLLHLHPDDAAAHGLDDGAPVAVHSDHGEVRARVRLDPALMRGAAWLPHGGGHGNAAGLRIASADPGVNPNALLPSGPGSYDPLSNQARMTGIPIRLRALEAQGAPATAPSRRTP